MDTNPVRLYNQAHKLGELSTACFVKDDSFTAEDIKQGGVGDCWFLSAMASIVGPVSEGQEDHTKFVIERLLQPKYNHEDPRARPKGIYRFQFFKMGEFWDVIIDDKLPSSKAGKKKLIRAKSSVTDEYWIPLLEKAYAKFSGGYKNLKGGWPCWALTELTGGIAIESTVS